MHITALSKVTLSAAAMQCYVILLKAMLSIRFFALFIKGKI